MTYRRRMILAAVCSVILHMAVLAPGGCRARPRGLAFSRHDPLVLLLQPEALPQQPSPPQQFVDVVAPAQDPVGTTDRIAEVASKAADTAPDDADTGAPRVEKIDAFDRISAPAPLPAPAAQPAPAPAREPVQAPEPRREELAAVPPEAAAPPLPVQDDRREDAAPAEDAAQPAPAPPALLSPQAASGRVQGGVKRTGLLSFEAMESEIAPYLKEIRQRVERNWRTALHVRYSGTSRTRAVVDCAIGPDGHIIAVQIVEAGDSATFAPLCKQAIENAGPFGPFPFKVPEVYRSQNLEIRWTFSFLE